MKIDADISIVPAPTSSSAPEQSITEIHEEGLRLFMGEGRLNRTVERLAKDLESHGIDYMIIGAIALIAHGYPRFTEDVDLVMTPEALDTFHRELIGLGYIPKFLNSKKKLKSTADGVSIEIITTGEYPGDGLPKPVSFPNPADASMEIDGVRVVTLDRLIELKLASGMTAPHRLRDLADVQELIKIHKLDEEFANRLNPFVREKYIELWRAVSQAGQFADSEPGSEEQEF
ncbi:MAG: hypothetical protein DMF61_18645 [Blastocatellia bacterium AA13]|nr:MAG: hypothetical protein DMF61_18645 [Blastocatellia bacterium AA13]